MYTMYIYLIKVTPRHIVHCIHILYRGNYGKLSKNRG